MGPITFYCGVLLFQLMDGELNLFLFDSQRGMDGFKKVIYFYILIILNLKT